MGSETIPPCKENVIHITLDVPLAIPSFQFGLLRTNSLLSTRAREIHTRYEVPGSDRPVYSFNNSALSYIPSVDGIVPESYKKYTLKNSRNSRRNLWNSRKRGKGSKTKTKKVVTFKNGSVSLC
jgi:hypothetical protein